MNYIEPPIPDNEESRLKALYSFNILDTPSEKPFDDIVELASKLCEAPIALISLIDSERQWFKAKVGLSVSETSRCVSFCAHAILDNEPLLINDTTKDRRFAGNPLVLGRPNIKFYLGIPLIVNGGHRIGTLCVIDSKEHDISETKVTALKVLANQVIVQLELRAQLQREQLLNEQLEISRLQYNSFESSTCLIEFDLNGKILNANKKYLELFDYELHEIIGKNHTIFVSYSERRENAYDIFWEILRTGQYCSAEFRRITKDRRDIWIRGSYNPVKNEKGEVYKIIKFAFDITKEKNIALTNLHKIKALDKTHATVEFNLNGEILDVNANFLNIVGYSRHELIGQNHSVLLSEEEKNSVEYLQFWRNLRRGDYQYGEFNRVTKDGKKLRIKGSYNPIFDIHGTPVKIVKFALDITKQYLESTAKSETIKCIYLSSAIIEFDINGYIINVNNNFLNIVQYGREEVLGKHHSILVSDDEFKSENYKRFWEELRNGIHKVGEFQRFNKFGEKVWIRGAYNPVCDATGKVYKIIKFTFDTTTEREASELILSKNLELERLNNIIAKSEARYRALSDASPLGIYGTTPDGDCIYVNDRYLQITGLSQKQLSGRGWLNAIHPQDRNRVDYEWYKAALENREYDSTHRFVKANGDIFWCRVKAAAIKEKNEVVGYVGVLEDITSRKEAEDRLKIATQAAQIGIWQWNINDNTLVWDATMFAIYGIAESDFSNSYDSWANCLLTEDRDLVEKKFQDCISKEERFETIFRIIRPDIEVRYIKSFGIVERDHDNTPIRMVGTNIDITEQIEREAELERTRNAAESATYTKSQFLANMSHEIRTPLTSIIGFAEAAMEPNVNNEDMTKSLSTILKNGTHLLGIINDILDLSKIDAGALKIEKLQFSPLDVVENLRSLMLPRIAEKGLSFVVNYHWKLPRLITSDSLRLMQILVNLVSNATKFTHAGKVELNVWSDPELENLHFSVTDSGIGISDEQLSRLFKPFSQSDEGTTRKFGGTGLGLSISKQLTQMLGGEITVTSIPDQGSTFSFFIKTGYVDSQDWISAIIEQKIQPIKTQSIKEKLNGRILIVDDASDNRDLLKFTLNKTGLMIKMAENGEEAIKLAVSEKFDVILLDMQMPVMDGYTAARELRKLGLKIPIVAFTANSMKHDILKCIDAGCTSHLPKPFTKEALINCLDKQLQQSKMII
jgi:PAS domain S-box-containing protein